MALAWRRGTALVRAAVALLCAWAACAPGVAATALAGAGGGLHTRDPAAAANIHTVFLTDCSPYSDWQTLAMVFGWRESGQAGPLTRVACCSDAERAAYDPALLSLVTTHFAPSYSMHPITGDHYPAYNKPAGVIHWLAAAPPAEEWLVVLDSDMILRRPFDPAELNLTRGWATGARYDYLIGVDNELAEHHIPHAPRLDDALAGPPGRRADRVGGFYVAHRDDLKRIAPLWLKYAEDVRADPEAWRLSGDIYARDKPGEKPWISEMYGYVFGAASLGIRHRWDESSMIYPGYTPTGVPRILHYGLLWQLEYDGGTWSYDKHWFSNFDMRVCPPWDTSVPKPQFGLFPAPPLPGQLRKNLTRQERYTDLISIEVVHTLNAALCEYHLTRCAPSDELAAACREAAAAYEQTTRAVRAMDAEIACTDLEEENCPNWAKAGECGRNPDFMRGACKLSCGLCSRAAFKPVSGTSRLAQLVAKLPQTPGQQAGTTHAALAAAADVAVERAAAVKAAAQAAAAGGSAATAAAEGLQAALQRAQEAEGRLPRQQQQMAGAQQPVVQPEPVDHDPSIELASHTVLAAAGGGGALGQQQQQQQQQEQNAGQRYQGAGVGDHATRAHARHLEKRALKRRCHKWSGLTMEQVKACLLSAQHGQEWHPDAAYDRSGDDGDGLDGLVTDAGSGGHGASDEHSAGGTTTKAGTPAAAAGAGVAAATPASRPGAATRLISSSASGRMTLFGALLAWVGIVGMFLSILPRLYHRAKRRSSHADPAAKLSV